MQIQVDAKKIKTGLHLATATDIFSGSNLCAVEKNITFVADWYVEK
jgi:hypothetical protein